MPELGLRPLQLMAFDLMLLTRCFRVVNFNLKKGSWKEWNPFKTNKTRFYKLPAARFIHKKLQFKSKFLKNFKKLEKIQKNRNFQKQLKKIKVV